MCIKCYFQKQTPRKCKVELINTFNIFLVISSPWHCKVKTNFLLTIYEEINLAIPIRWYTLSCVLLFIHPCKTQRRKSNTDNKTFPLLLIYSHYHNKSLLPDQDGDGILTAEEYRRTFHEHGLFVGKVWKTYLQNFVERF